MRIDDVSLLRRQLADTREELDAALATIRTVSDHLHEAKREVRLLGNALEAARTARFRVRRSSPTTEVESAPVVGDVKVSSLPQTVVVDGVEKTLAVEVGQLPNDAGIQCERVEFRVVGDPARYLVSSGRLAREHEVDALVEHVFQLEVRLVTDLERRVSNDEVPTELTHDFPDRVDAEADPLRADSTIGEPSTRREAIPPASAESDTGVA